MGVVEYGTIIEVFVGHLRIESDQYPAWCWLWFWLDW